MGFATDSQDWRRAGEISLDATRSVGFYDDIPGLSRCSNIFAQVESCYRDGPLRNPVRHLLVIYVRQRGVWRSRFWGSCRRCGERLRFARCQKRPTRRIVEGKIEIRHGHSTIGIPCPACSNVEQAVARLSQHFSTIDKAQTDLLSFPRRLGQNYGYQVVAAARQPGAFHRRVMDKLHCLPVRLDGLDLQKARQFEHQKARTTSHHVELQCHVTIHFFGWFHPRINDVAAHPNRISPRLRFCRQSLRNFLPSDGIPSRSLGRE